MVSPQGVQAFPVRAESLCMPFVANLRVSAASISVVGFRGRQSSVCVSDALAARADSLQFELGEGPRWESMRSRAPVLVPDWNSAEPSLWPVFHAEAAGLGIHALFSFPMVMGAALVGVVDLYCLSPRVADSDFVALGALMAGRVASAAVQRALSSAEDHHSPETVMAPALRREVHQATGMIVSQLRVSATEAFSRLQAHAFLTERPIAEVAREVVERTLTFTEAPD